MVTARRFALLGALAATAALSAQPAGEYQIKAAFLFNFVHFVEWPEGAFANRGAPFAICVLGDDPFGAMLDEVVAGETVDAHKLVVRRLQRAGDAENCHLLFVSRSEHARLQDVLRAIGGMTPVLTVSDIDGFVGDGGAIGFFFDRNRVRFEIGVKHAQRRGLKFSSQLLSVARIRDAGGAS